MLKLKTPAQEETLSTLLSMGYKPEMISMAMEESQDPTLDKILDLLLFKEDKYANALTKKNKKAANPPSNNIFEELGNPKVRKAKKNKRKESNKKDSLKDDSNEEKEEKEDEPEKVVQEVSLPKVMDEESANYLNSIRRSLNQIDSKDPNEYVSILSEHLKNLKFNTSDTGKSVHKCLSSGAYYNQVVDVRKKIYEVIMKVMTMKRQADANLQEFEYVLLMAFETRLLNHKQMDLILNSYNKFCNKRGHSQDDALVSSLERHHVEAKKAQSFPNNNNMSSNQDVDNNILHDYAILKCPNVTSVKAKVMEESKISDANVDENKKAVKKRPFGHSEKEFCIVCMEKTREIVFLPCCHFLTCPHCSPKVSKCPICEKRIEKNLKIFWS